MPSPSVEMLFLIAYLTCFIAIFVCFRMGSFQVLWLEASYFLENVTGLLREPVSFLKRNIDFSKVQCEVAVNALCFMYESRQSWLNFLFRAFLLTFVLLPIAFFLNPLGNLLTFLSFFYALVTYKGPLLFAYKGIVRSLFFFIFLPRMVLSLHILFCGTDVTLNLLGGPDTSLLWLAKHIKDFIKENYE